MDFTKCRTNILPWTQAVIPRDIMTGMTYSVMQKENKKMEKEYKGKGVSGEVGYEDEMKVYWKIDAPINIMGDIKKEFSDLFPSKTRKKMSLRERLSYLRKSMKSLKGRTMGKLMESMGVKVTYEILKEV